MKTNDVLDVMTGSIYEGVDEAGYGEAFLASTKARYEELYSSDITKDEARDIYTIEMMAYNLPSEKQEFNTACHELISMGKGMGIPIHGIAQSESKSFKKALYKAHDFLVRLGAENFKRLDKENKHV